MSWFEHWRLVIEKHFLNPWPKMASKVFHFRHHSFQVHPIEAEGFFRHGEVESQHTLLGSIKEQLGLFYGGMALTSEHDIHDFGFPTPFAGVVEIVGTLLQLPAGAD